VDNDQLTLSQIARRARREFPHREVLSREDDGMQTTTYDALFERVDRLAHALASIGVKRGDRVATVGWNHRRHLELYLALTTTGAVLHTVNVRLGPDQLREVIEHAGDVALFAEDDVAAEHAQWFGPRGPVIAFGATTPGVTAYDDLLDAQPGTAFAYPELDEREPAAMAYSSATTGRPKGVVYSHRALYLHSMMLCMKDTWAISEADTVLPVVPMFHVNAWGLPFAAVWMGSRLVLPGRRPTADDLLPLLDGTTFAAAVPTIWMDVFARMSERGLRFPSLRTVVSGGAPLPASLLRQADRLDVPLIHSYGMTEASPVVLVGQVRSDLEPTEERRLKQGFVVPGLDYAVESAGGADAADQRGELRLRGPWVAEQYERDERGRDTFVDGWYRTGDVVTLDQHGYVHVVDRMNDLVKSGGEWISTLELEDALSTFPGVTACAVVGVPDERWQERPRAYVVAAQPLDPAAVKAHLAERFPRFWVPDEIVTVESLPLTSVGKYDKRRLRADAGAHLSTP
jgi:fatty-acyl-CoA synthase